MIILKYGDAMQDFQTAFKNFLAEYRATGDYVTAEEIADHLYVSRSAVYKWTQKRHANT